MREENECKSHKEANVIITSPGPLSLEGCDAPRTGADDL